MASVVSSNLLILLIEKGTSPQSIHNSAAWTKKKMCIFSNCVNINFSEIMIFAGYKQIATGVSHFEVSRETGLLFRIALWDCFGTLSLILLAITIAHFTVTVGNEAGVDLVLIQPCLLCSVKHVFVILNSIF